MSNIDNMKSTLKAEMEEHVGFMNTRSKEMHQLSKPIKHVKNKHVKELNHFTRESNKVSFYTIRLTFQLK